MLPDAETWGRSRSRATGAPDRRERPCAIGCGAVGSHTVVSLAESGVGDLVLIDPDKMRAENVQRHALGAADIGSHKVSGLERVLLRRFPHLKVRSVPKSVQDALDNEASLLDNADLIVVAIAEENVEFQLNEFLHGGAPRLHVWLEPLGLGGHILRVAGKRPGCFACLYRMDDQHGLLNMASLLQPGQKFQRTLAGCAGTFHPFGAVDAQRAGTEVTREAITCLTAQNLEPLLMSWVASKSGVLSSGYQLSSCGEEIAESSTRIVHKFSAPDCPVCGRAGA